MKPILKSLSKFTVCILIFMTVYPLVALANGFFERNNTAVESILLVCFGTAVFYLRGFLINRSAPPFATFFAPIILIAVGFFGAFIYLMNEAIFPMIAGCILILLVGIFAFFIAGREPSDLLSTAVLGWITGIDLISFFVITKFAFPFAGIVLLLDYFLLCAMKFILVNQDTLEDLTTSRHYSFAALPQKIRSYNFALVARMLAIITAAFLIFRNLKAILTWLFEKISAFLKYIISKLLGLFSSNSEMSEEIADSTPNMQKPMLPSTDSGSSWLWDILYYIFMFAILCGLIALVVYLVYRISRWKIPKKLKEITPEYTDSEQILESKKKKQQKQDNRHRWNRDYSAYRKMQDSEEKFHIGYSLAIRGLLLHGLPLLHSDTTCEIDGKAAEKLQEKAYHTATNDYNIMVYGENEYSPEAVKSLDKALNEISELKM